MCPHPRPQSSLIKTLQNHQQSRKTQENDLLSRNLPQLPREILFIVVQNMSQGTLAHFVRASKDLYALGVSCLYRSPCLKYPASLQPFANTIKDNPSYGSWVKNLVLYSVFSPSWDLEILEPVAPFFDPSYRLFISISTFKNPKGVHRSSVAENIVFLETGFQPELPLTKLLNGDKFPRLKVLKINRYHGAIPLNTSRTQEAMDRKGLSKVHLLEMVKSRLTADSLSWIFGRCRELKAFSLTLSNGSGRGLSTPQDVKTAFQRAPSTLTKIRILTGKDATRDLEYEVSRSILLDIFEVCPSLQGISASSFFYSIDFFEKYGTRLEYFGISFDSVITDMDENDSEMSYNGVEGDVVYCRYDLYIDTESESQTLGAVELLFSILTMASSLVPNLQEITIWTNFRDVKPFTKRALEVLSQPNKIQLKWR